MDALDRIDGVVVTHEPSELDAVGRDFGGLVCGRAVAIARPAHTDALVALVELARREGLVLAARSQGLSQSGQSIPTHGVSVDMRGFEGIEVSPVALTATVGAGVTWRALLARTAAEGLAPVTMPLNTDISIGGTLAAGGMGSTSHHHGMAVSTVVAVTVVTGAGELVEATVDHRRDVFDAVLGGIGQFGFICRATIRLRPLRRRTRTYHLLYDDLGALLDDELRLAAQPWCTHLEGFASAAMQGLVPGPAGRRVPFARWFFGLHVSREFEPDREPDTDETLAGLQFRERLRIADSDSREYATRYDLRFEMMRATGAWRQVHPWLECMLSASHARQAIPAVLERLPLALGDGHRIMPIADVDRPRLLVQPSERPVIAFAVLPAGVPEPLAPAMLTALQAIHRELVDGGAKRYLSGWLFEPDEAAWRAHFGDDYELWCTRKRELDPSGVLRSCLRMPA